MKAKSIVATVVGTLVLSAGAAFAEECFQPTSWPPTNNFGFGTCYNCSTSNLHAAGVSLGSKRLGVLKPQSGPAHIAYVFGMNWNGSTDTPVPSCYAEANGTYPGSSLPGCSSFRVDPNSTPNDLALFSKTPAGSCNSANHWYLDSNNW